MAGEWREVAVEDVKARSENALATGPFGSSIASRFFTHKGVPVIRGSNLSEDIGIRLNDEGLVFLSLEKAQEFNRSIVREGDLVFTCWGTVNQVGLIDRRARYEKYVISNKQMKLTSDPSKADSLFLYYVFSSPELQQRIKNQSIGSSVPGFNLSQLRTMRISLPEVEEQRSIARILGSLDDKVELNRQISESLETIARALFKSWFVDFDPVRAKAEGRDLGLPKDVADLFPARLADSELGEIPEGWRLEDLGSVTSYLIRGISPSYVEQGGVLVLNQKCIRDGHVDTSKGRRHDPEARGITGRTLKPGDVLVNSTGVGTLGRVGQMLTVDADTIVDSHITVVRAREQVISSNYLGINLSGRADEIETLGEGSTGQTELSRARLANLPVLIPPRRLIAAFDRLTGSLRERAARSKRESITLDTLRDALLPKLISGELRVKEFDQLITPAV